MNGYNCKNVIVNMTGEGFGGWESKLTSHDKANEARRVC